MYVFIPILEMTLPEKSSFDSIRSLEGFIGTEKRNATDLLSRGNSAKLFHTLLEKWPYKWVDELKVHQGMTKAVWKMLSHIANEHEHFQDVNELVETWKLTHEGIDWALKTMQDDNEHFDNPHYEWSERIAMYKLYNNINNKSDGPNISKLAFTNYERLIEELDSIRDNISETSSNMNELPIVRNVKNIRDVIADQSNSKWGRHEKINQQKKSLDWLWIDFRKVILELYFRNAILRGEIDWNILLYGTKSVTNYYITKTLADSHIKDFTTEVSQWKVNPLAIFTLRVQKSIDEYFWSFSDKTLAEEE